MARLVAQHQPHQLLEERVVGALQQAHEGRNGQAFHHHLHAEELEVPAAFHRDGLDQVEQVLGAGIFAVQLLVNVARKHLHVPGFVEGLGGGVELRVHVRHGRGQLRGGLKGALFAVHELADQVGVVFDGQALLFFLAHLEEPVGFGPGRVDIKDLPFQVHVGVPRQVVGVPLGVHAPPVQLAHLGQGHSVIPDESGGLPGIEDAVALHDAAQAHFVARAFQDRIEIGI